MQIQGASIFNCIHPFSKNKAKGESIVSEKISTGIPVEITEPCQIILGKDFYLNSRNSRITEGLKNKNYITIGSDKSCNIQTSSFHDGVEKTHLTIKKDNDKLILTNHEESGETHIVSKENVKPFYKSTKDIDLGQENVGDCYLLSTIRALSHSDWGANAIKEMVKIDKNGNYVVTFINQKPITITIDELNGDKEKKSVSGELGIKAIERAYAKLAKDNVAKSNINFLNEGGDMGVALKLMTGLDSKKYSTADKNLEIILNEISQKGTNNFVLTCGTQNEGKHNGFVDKDKKFHTGHAYAIKSINNKDKTIELINPHNTKTSQTVSWTEFKEVFKCIFVANVPN